MAKKLTDELCILSRENRDKRNDDEWNLFIKVFNYSVKNEV